MRLDTQACIPKAGGKKNKKRSRVWRLNHQTWWNSSSCIERAEQHIVKEISGIVGGENPFYFNPIWVWMEGRRPCLHILQPRKQPVWLWGEGRGKKRRKKAKQQTKSAANRGKECCLIWFSESFHPGIRAYTFQLMTQNFKLGWQRHTESTSNIIRTISPRDVSRLTFPGLDWSKSWMDEKFLGEVVPL